MYDRFFNAMMEIVCHTILVLALLGCFWTVETFVAYLWGPKPKILWGVLDMRQIFDTADAAVLTSFFASGTWHAIRAYNGWDKRK